MNLAFCLPSGTSKVRIPKIQCLPRIHTRYDNIAENAGAEGSVIVGKLMESSKENEGYDAVSGTFTDMVKAGVIDPTKVVRSSLQNAASVAALLITTEAMVADKPEPKEAAPAAPDMGGMGGMGGMGF